jgi:hypothetical protein
MKYKHILVFADLFIVVALVFFAVQLKLTDSRLSKYTFCTYAGSVADGPTNMPCIGGDLSILPAPVTNDESLQTTDIHLLIISGGALFTAAAVDGFYISRIKKSDRFVLLSLLLIIIIPWLTFLPLSLIQADSYITSTDKAVLGYVMTPILLILDYVILNYGIRLAHKIHSLIWLSLYAVTLIAVTLLTAGAVVYLVTTV